MKFELSLEQHCLGWTREGLKGWPGGGRLGNIVPLVNEGLQESRQVLGKDDLKYGQTILGLQIAQKVPNLGLKG